MLTKSYQIEGTQLQAIIEHFKNSCRLPQTSNYIHVKQCHTFSFEEYNQGHDVMLNIIINKTGKDCLHLQLVTGAVGDLRSTTNTSVEQFTIQQKHQVITRIGAELNWHITELDGQEAMETTPTTCEMEEALV